MPDLASELLDGTVGSQAEPSLTEPSLAGLSVRELQLLHLVAEGLTTREIAARLKVNFKTAACRQNRLFEKLHAPSRFAAVRSAIHNGMIAA